LIVKRQTPACGGLPFLYKLNLKGGRKDVCNDAESREISEKGRSRKRLAKKR
jgi:hypothetical protein